MIIRCGTIFYTIKFLIRICLKFCEINVVKCLLWEFLNYSLVTFIVILFCILRIYLLSAENGLNNWKIKTKNVILHFMFWGKLEHKRTLTNKYSAIKTLILDWNLLHYQILKPSYFFAQKQTINLVFLFFIIYTWIFCYS